MVRYNWETVYSIEFIVDRIVDYYLGDYELKGLTEDDLLNDIFNKNLFDHEFNISYNHLLKDLEYMLKELNKYNFKNKVYQFTDISKNNSKLKYIIDVKDLLTILGCYQNIFVDVYVEMLGGIANISISFNQIRFYHYELKAVDKEEYLKLSKR